ncbi:MAG: hypothetical protein RJA34_296 [Pseudomonadota bacterium]
MSIGGELNPVPQPPPYTRARIVSGPFSFGISPREVLRGAAGGYLPKRPESATFSARAVSILCLACGYAARVALTKSTTYDRWFVVKEGHRLRDKPRHGNWPPVPKAQTKSFPRLAQEPHASPPFADQLIVARIVSLTEHSGLSPTSARAGFDPLLRLFDVLRLQLHGTKAVYLAVDVVVTVDQADIFDLGTDLHDCRRTFDFQVLD